MMDNNEYGGTFWLMLVIGIIGVVGLVIVAAGGA